MAESFIPRPSKHATGNLRVRGTQPLSEDECWVQQRQDKKINGVYADNQHKGAVAFDPDSRQYLCEECRK